MIDRATRVAILASAIGALVTTLFFGSWNRSELRFLALAIGVVLVAAVWHHAIACAAVIAAGPIAPAVLNAVDGMSPVTAASTWLALLLTIIIATTRARGWSLPRRWTVPLALWGLTVAVAWPIVIGREADFSLAQLHNVHSAVSGLGVSPPAEAYWISSVALTQLVGILWFDMLWSAFAPEDPDAFRRQIVWPSAAVIFVSALVAVYQMTVDASFLNRTVYGGNGRAAGLMMDGNAFGTVAAMWVAGFTALAFSSTGKTRWIAGAAACTTLLGMWGTGSRTSLLAASCSLAGVAIAVGMRLQSRRAQRLLLAVVAAGVTAGLLFVVIGEGPMANRLRRSAYLGSSDQRGIVEYLWNRDGFGSSAVRMIQDFPAVGIGVGTFQAILLDYSRAMTPPKLVPPDNAQNWFRHQVAEFGVVGSIGWALFAISLTASLARSLVLLPDPRTVLVAAGIVGIGMASMLGMPTQNAVALMAFWTFVFWHETARQIPAETIPLRRWGMALATLVIFVTGTMYYARADLRVPHRAERFDWPYAYGFYQSEAGPWGEVRWAARHGVMVLDRPKPWMRLTVAVNHSDIATNPVDARVWFGRRLVFDRRLTTVEPVTQYLLVNDVPSRVTLETDVDHVLRPREHGINDDRELGLLVGWEFLEGRPNFSATPRTSPPFASPHLGAGAPE